MSATEATIFLYVRYNKEPLGLIIIIYVYDILLMGIDETKVDRSKKN